MRANTAQIRIVEYTVCAVLFALAGVLQYIDNDLSLLSDK